MAIAGFDRAKFEATLPVWLTPTTPIRSTEFLRGRQKLLADIGKAFLQPGRHVFIHGDRGAGKTSLAQTAAFEHQSSDGAPIIVGCDNASTFYGVAKNLAQKLKLSPDPTVTKTTTSGKLGGGWQGFISAEAQKSVERGQIPSFNSVDDVISVIGFLANKHSTKPVIVIDEFERIQDASERMLFADFIKQVGDQSVSVKLVFCGIGQALGDLLDSHHSCYRYLSAVPVERLAMKPRIEIISEAAKAFGITVDKSTLARFAAISDGFPHYIHLLTEKLLWEVFEDLTVIKVTTPDHYAKAVKEAVNDIEPHLKAMYEKATLKYKPDYEKVLWAVADHHELKRRSTDIYTSYVRLMRSKADDALAREVFNQRMNALKRVSHGSILKANRQGWYEFSEAVVRGYVRLRAEALGYELGGDHPLEGNSPGSLAKQQPSNVFKSRS